MHLRDNPTALLISNTSKSILVLNVVRKECVLNLQGKVVYFLWLKGSMLEASVRAAG